MSQYQNNDSEQLLMKKQQISRILDIDQDTPPQNASQTAVYILGSNSYNAPSGMTKEQYFELQVKCRTRQRQRNLSSGSEGSCESQVEKSLFTPKEIIYHDLKDDDTLQKLAIIYSCTVAEIKLANKIYTDQELHARRTAKVPVVKGGRLHYDYLSKNDTPKEPQSTALDFTSNDIDSKCKFRVAKPFEINPDLSLMSTDDEDYDIYDSKDAHKLLRDEPIQEVRFGQAIGTEEPSMDDFMKSMDAKISRDVEEVESKKDNLDQVIDALNTPVIFPTRKSKHEKYGSVCSCTWVHFLFLFCIIAVVAPLVYLIYFYYGKHHHTKMF